MPYYGLGKRKRRRSAPRRNVRTRVSYGYAPTRTRTKTKSGVGVTVQHDRKQVYIKRRMPRYKRRRWVKFVKKVNFAVTKQLGTKTVVFNDTIQASATAGLQSFMEANLYGLLGGVDAIGGCGARDLFTIANNDPVNLTGKLIYCSAVLDITFINATTTETNPNSAVAEVDVYEVYYKGQRFGYDYFQDMLADGFNDTSNINAGTPLTLATRGVTPFECPEGITKGKFVIFKKTKFLLGRAQTATYQVRDSRQHTIGKDEAIGTSATIAKPGWTKTIFFIVKSVVSSDAVVVQAGCTRKYSYKVLEQSNDADNVL